MNIYLDHAATTPVLPEAAAAALRSMTEEFGNPSSVHQLGAHAATSLAEHRSTIASALGCLPEELFFTSGGTEGNNWAISMAAHIQKRHGTHILTTAVEHSATLEPLRALEQQGYEVTYLMPDRSGHISVSQVEAALRPDTVLVSMMLVNNETGNLFPVRETARLMKNKQSKALLHSDAVQAFLKLPFTPEALGADFLSLSAHKIGGPKGCGALYIKKGISPVPWLLGGGQEGGLRAGTEATHQIAAFAKACQIGSQNALNIQADTANIKAYALKALKARVPKLVVVSEGDAPHICAISLPGYPSEMLVRDLSDHGIFVSSGSACHKGKASHVFAAQNLPPKVLLGMLRLSFSSRNTTKEIDALCVALSHIVDTRISIDR